MMLLGAVLLVAAVVLFILEPILRGQWAPMDRDESELTETESRRRVSLLALRDVEYDYHTGKLDDTDYQAMRKELSSEALAALEAARAEATDDRADDLEAEIAAVREGLRSGTTCEDCGHRNPEGSRYCASCGQRLVAREATAGS